MSTFLDRAVSGRPFQTRTLTTRLTNAQIKTLAVDPINLSSPLLSEIEYRQFLGGAIWLDTRAGAYTNIEAPTNAGGELPASNVIDLYLTLNGDNLFAPFPFEDVYTAFATERITKFPLISRTRLLQPDTGQLTLNHHNKTEVMAVPQTYNSWPAALNTQMTVAMDNYTGDFDVDLGALTGGHSLNKMIVDLYFVQLPVPAFRPDA